MKFRADWALRGDMAFIVGCVKPCSSEIIMRQQAGMLRISHGVVRQPNGHVTACFL
ncbi:hypothetical protein IG605_010935 [Pectobacterium quasiaquaticum]|uniref:Uncharacterized protein n=1 Tax=Pectobacterium quasiaquaticum TaxID=2774015 RepID=A0A9Q2ES33_9GAMM|nr:MULTISPECIES: hypothetical protein [Pectobacterium]MBE5202386.1 hypothetical protein [Pectobacterium quasiaquaticum]MBE5208627.1 hypothetical protein [Pectobacterium quasiaquaticum]MBE5214151.1 hypothetical protein [Pectobacterium quasiaquaticum]MBE5219972.1 hypothetical protein [Pectobacterium quasiaquaticum]MBE5226351.1 hypothetical protein [Pectobacterium quasiaquaticum]